MIVNWPEKIPAGRVSDAPWSAVDFAPTALEIGYLKPVTNFAGISVLPVLTGKLGKIAPDSTQPLIP
jgi:arylsulfatase A-like enzyme